MNYQNLPYFEERLEEHFKLIFLLQEGEIDKPTLFSKWKTFSDSELFQFNQFYEEQLFGIGWEGAEDFSPRTHDYADYLKEYIESLGNNFYDWRDNLQDIEDGKEERRREEAKRKLAAIPKYPPDEKGESIPPKYWKDLVNLYQHIPDNEFIKNILINPTRKYWLHQIHGLESFIKNKKKELDLWLLLSDNTSWKYDVKRLKP